MEKTHEKFDAAASSRQNDLQQEQLMSSGNSSSLLTLKQRSTKRKELLAKSLGASSTESLSALLGTQADRQAIRRPHFSLGPSVISSPLGSSPLLPLKETPGFTATSSQPFVVPYLAPADSVDSGSGKGNITGGGGSTKLSRRAGQDFDSDEEEKVVIDDYFKVLQAEEKEYTGSSTFLKGTQSANPHNDYSQHFVDTGHRPQNFIRDPGLAERFEEYPKLKELIKLKVLYYIGNNFDILTRKMLPPGTARGRQCLRRWGFRRCEDICWVKRNTRNPGVRQQLEPEAIFQRTKEHCLMGIKGTVRRSLDGDFIHANVDIDLIITEEPGPETGSDPRAKPEETFLIAEHFCLGKRRLHIFGRDDTLRPGWLTIGSELSTSNFDAKTYRNFFDKEAKYTTGCSERIEALRPKSPVPVDRSGGLGAPKREAAGSSGPGSDKPRHKGITSAAVTASTSNLRRRHSSLGLCENRKQLLTGRNKQARHVASLRRAASYRTPSKTTPLTPATRQAKRPVAGQRPFKPKIRFHSAGTPRSSRRHHPRSDFRNRKPEMPGTSRAPKR